MTGSQCILFEKQLDFDASHALWPDVYSNCWRGFYGVISKVCSLFAGDL